jgi:hypothetical protein
MAKLIELPFNNSLGKVVKLSVDSSNESFFSVRVKEVMVLIDGNIGTFVSPKEAEKTLIISRFFGCIIYSHLSGTFILMRLIQNESLHLLPGCPSPWILLL